MVERQLYVLVAEGAISAEVVLHVFGDFFLVSGVQELLVADGALEGALLLLAHIPANVGRPHAANAITVKRFPRTDWYDYIHLERQNDPPCIKQIIKV